MLLQFATASLVTEHTGAWHAEDRAACIDENQTASPAVIAEREAIIPRAPTLRLDAAAGVGGGFGNPGGVGGYFGHADDGTPASGGWSGFLRADVFALRPVWLSVQTHAFTAPNFGSASFMTDVLAGWDFHGYGNSWSAMRMKHSRDKVYECIFGRHDVALVGGVKDVIIRGDPRLPSWRAIMAGTQLRFLRQMFGGSFGIDFDVLGLYDPSVGGAGAQAQYVLHIGAFDVTQNIGFVWHRGAWGTIGIGAGFDL